MTDMTDIDKRTEKRLRKEPKESHRSASLQSVPFPNSRVQGCRPTSTTTLEFTFVRKRAAKEAMTTGRRNGVRWLAVLVALVCGLLRPRS